MAIGWIVAGSAAVLLLLAVVGLVWMNVAAKAAFKKALQTSGATLQQNCSARRLVALVTGANSGVGLELARQLAMAGVHVVMACRDPARGAAALQVVQAASANAKAELLRMDVSDLSSVDAGVAEFHKRHAHLDMIYCNAGIFPSTGLRSAEITKAVLCCQLRHTLLTGRRSPSAIHIMVGRQGMRAANGLGLLFMTHVLGHYHLIQSLSPLLLKSPHGRIIWTGSRAATNNRHAHLEDMQHLNGPEPYASSKYFTDAISRALNEQFISRNQHVRSFVCCPGFVATGVAPPLMASLQSLVKFLRPLFPSNFNVSTTRGCAVIMLLSAVSTASVDYSKKYATDSHARFVQTATGSFNVDPQFAVQVMKDCDALIKKLRSQQAAAAAAGAGAATAGAGSGAAGTAETKE